MDKDPELKLNDYLKGIVLNLPEGPGIYQYLNSEGTIIYVGKAKNLKRRVSSYFNRDHGPGKTRVLVSKIADIRYIVVNTEEDALLLENNLIKKYKPRYNVLLKDDKTYPSICIQNEYFPRIFKTRRIIRNGSSYYGPYSHLPSMYAVLDLIKHLYPLRTCNLNLTPENIRAGKFNVCLEYHIKNCAGPCVGRQSLEDYQKNIDEIKEILKGNTRDIARTLYRQMQQLAEEMRFEEAQLLKEKYLLIENYRSKSEVVSSVLHNIDVFASRRTTTASRPSSTTCTSPTAPSTKPSPSSTRSGSTSRKKNCWPWASPRCAPATTATRAKSSSPSTPAWSWPTSPSPCPCAATNAPCWSCRSST